MRTGLAVIAHAACSRRILGVLAISHLVTGLMGKLSEFCFPKTLDVSRGEGKHRGLGETKLTFTLGASH